MKWRGLSTEASDSARLGVSLADRLLEIKAGIAEYVRPDNQAINQRAIAEIAATGIAEQILAVGQPAPTFALTNHNGETVRSSELLIKGKLVISFFRGRWCPFCVTELEAWREVYPQLEAAGVGLVAVSPQTPKHNAFTADQHKLRFPLLSDPENAVARQFGLVYCVPEYQQKLYRSVFINLPLTNGDQSWELPLPATYVIGQDGTVLFAEASANYMERPEIVKVLERVP
jgi:peroxiredoxin